MLNECCCRDSGKYCKVTRVKNLKIVELLLSKTSSVAAHGAYGFCSRSIGMIGKRIGPRVVISASRSIRIKLANTLTEITKPDESRPNTRIGSRGLTYGACNLTA